jgi:predicted acetyltransferase
MYIELQIRKPDYQYLYDLFEMGNEYIENNEESYNYETIEDAKKRIDSDIKYEKGEVPEGKLQSYAYWFYQNNVLIGTSRLRPVLNDRFRIKGGNIGYDVRPKYRKMGYGTEILRMTINEAKNKSMSVLLVTCDDANIGSCKVIEHNYGKLINKVEYERSIIRRYEITI